MSHSLLLQFRGAADPIRRATPHLTDPIRPAGAPGAETVIQTNGTPALGQG
jgi:hypothetical protein